MNLKTKLIAAGIVVLLLAGLFGWQQYKFSQAEVRYTKRVRTLTDSIVAYRDSMQSARIAYRDERYRRVASENQYLNLQLHTNAKIDSAVKATAGLSAAGLLIEGRKIRNGR